MFKKKSVSSAGSGLLENNFLNTQQEFNSLVNVVVWVVGLRVCIMA